MQRRRCHEEPMSTTRALPGARAVLFTTRRAWLGRMGAGALAVAATRLGLAAERTEADTYDEASTLQAAVDFFGQTTEGLALVYNLPQAQAIFKRYPGVDGSLYYIGGVGLHYQRLDGVTLAPIRLGVGLRAGASVGYTHYRPEKSLNPL